MRFGAIEGAVAKAHNEEEFKVEVDRQLSDVASALGINLDRRLEYTLGTGPADAVYSRLIIEYERPGSLRNNLQHKHTRHAVEQTAGYIERLASTEG